MAKASVATSEGLAVALAIEDIAATVGTKVLLSKVATISLDMDSSTLGEVDGLMVANLACRVVEGDLGSAPLYPNPLRWPMLCRPLGKWHKLLLRCLLRRPSVARHLLAGSVLRKVQEWCPWPKTQFPGWQGGEPTRAHTTTAFAASQALEVGGVKAATNAMVIDAAPDQANKSTSAAPTQKGINLDTPESSTRGTQKRKTCRIVIVAIPKVIQFMNAMLFYAVKFATVIITKSCAQI
jgi:hypothetical protein